MKSSRVSRAARLARARARRHSDGAVMFIVVVTLGLLAAMGVYGLSATQSDIKAAGHMREALQSQRAGEHALMMTAESLNPMTADGVVGSMSSVADRTTNCKTAAPYGGSGPILPGVACKRLKEADMLIIGKAANANAWAKPGFAADSFGAVQSTPSVEVELSNPIDLPPASGYGSDPTLAPPRFAQVTVTVIATTRATGFPSTPAQSAVMGRGRMTVGPIKGPIQKL